MSSRALRRLQKQQEEQKAQQLVEDDVSDHDDAPVKSKQSAFAFLNEAEEDDGEDNDDDDDNDNKASETVQNVTAKPATTRKSDVAEPAKPKSSSKKKKKKKSKGTKTMTTHDITDEDDIDAVLASVAQDQQVQNTSTVASDGQTSKQDALDQLLIVDSQHLHAINEMRRLFGRDAIGDQPRAPQPGAARRGGRGQRVQQEGRGFPAVSLKRNIFVQGKEEWPRATTGGLGMEVVHKDPVTRVTEYRFVHSMAYQDTQRQYEIAVASMDPQRLLVLLQHNPYHIATLLQVSEIMKHDRMHTEAGDVLERALFAFGRTVHSTFGAALSAGKARLSFNRPENREFFLASWRYVQDLSMRSTWRTVYEWAKLLFSLEPELDPYGLGLVLDQYALRANQAEHYLKFYDTGIFSTQTDLLWDVRYSLALCFLRVSRHDEARSTLRTAIEHDRFTAHTLCKILEIEPLPAPLWAHHEAPDAKSALFSAMYTTRAKDLWNTPEAKALLSSVAKELPKTEPQASPSAFAMVTFQAARHIYLTENDAFMRLLAACEVVENAQPGDRPTQDPFPPLTEKRSYDPRPVGGRPGTVAPGIEALGRLGTEQMQAIMQELARMRMGGGVEGEGSGADEDEEEDDDFSDDDIIAGTAR